MFTNLLIVVAAGLLAPLALGFFPRVRLPAIVLEIVLGIVIGPSGLGWAKPDAPVSILALIGLAFLLFLSGLEIDPERLRGPGCEQRRQRGAGAGHYATESCRPMFTNLLIVVAAGLLAPLALGFFPASGC